MCKSEKCYNPCADDSEYCAIHLKDMNKENKFPSGRKRNLPKTRKKATGKKKQRTLADLRKELWVWTSLLIRLEEADEQGYVTCIVRGNRMYWWKDGAHCGHFVRKSKSGQTEFLEHNLFVQSAGSNLAEEQYEMGVAINKLFEQGKTKYSADELIALSNIPFKKDRIYYEETIRDYKTRVFKLTRQKNLDEWVAGCPKKYINSLNMKFKR